MANEDIAAVQRSQEFFRLKQVVQSPGDIYEIDESAKAIYIGPDSDIGEVQVTYYNPDEPNSLETAVVSVNGPLVGRIDSLPVTKVSSTGQPARILVNPVDIVDNNYQDPDSTAERKFNVPANIDLMVALKPLPDIPSVRADRTLRLSQVPYTKDPESGDGSTDIVIPIYGRRLVTVQCYAPLLDANVIHMAIGLVTLVPGVAAPKVRWLTPEGISTSIVVVPANSVRAAVIRASDAARHGATFDLAGDQNGWTVESDQPPDIDNILGLPAPRGMADLLFINIKNVNLGEVGEPTTLFSDLFVKVADRET